MTGNPTTQVFQCVMHTSMPASELGQDVASILNMGGTAIYDDAITAALMVDQFLGQINATSVSVAGSTWSVSANGQNCDLSYNMTVVSDPATASGLQTALVNVWDLVLVAIGIGLAALGTSLGGVGGIVVIVIGAILGLAGALQLFGVDVTGGGLGGGLGGSIGTFVLEVGVPLLLIGGGLVLIAGALNDSKSSTKKSVRAHTT